MDIEVIRQIFNELANKYILTCAHWAEETNGGGMEAEEKANEEVAQLRSKLEEEFEKRII